MWQSSACVSVRYLIGFHSSNSGTRNGSPRVVTAYGEYKGTGAWLRYVLHVREVLLPVELFYGVAVVPVPGDDNPSAILFYACGKAALTVQTAEAPETVGGGAVHLYRKELPYAQGLLMATAYHHLS